VGQVRQNVVTNGNHPSIFVWSIANELSSRAGPAQSTYIERAAEAAKKLDSTRPVGLAVAGYPSAGCQAGYGPLDIVGINEYFGWYPGPNGILADRSTLTDYLDKIHACYPDKAVFITEFGAEANRDGPVEEKGTYAHQQDFVGYHLGVHRTKPWLNGVMYWALHEFRVKPKWEGGNPRPSPPWHQKGVIMRDGTKKPAFFDLQREYQSVVQYRARGR
jgi:beta-galactosidase/beta-glucuronidase